MEKIYYKVSRLLLVGGLMTVLVAVAATEVVWLNGKSTEKRLDSNYMIGMSQQAAEVKSGVVLAKDEMSVNSETVSEDARPLIIKRYLEKYKSPLAPYSDLIFQLSEDYGFEYYWIVAIAQQESNLCKKIPENSHNCWGYGIHKNGTLRFDSYELSLKSYAEYLKRVYFDKGLNTAELIMKKYCPSSNGSWAYGVNHFIAELESGDF